MKQEENYGKGQLLISEPFMQDPNFKRSVTLICEHGEKEGSAGLVLNRKMMLKLGETVPELSKYNFPLYMGGPVANDTLHFLHNIGEELDGSNKITEGLWWGGNFQRLKIMLEFGSISEKNIRFFIGYSGWEPGQLKMEMQEESWITHPARAQHVFEFEPEKLWEKVLLEKGGKYKQIINYPEDPLLN